MIKLLPVRSSKIAWILLIIMFSGCSSDEEEMKEVEASAPEETFLSDMINPMKQLVFHRINPLVIVWFLRGMILMQSNILFRPG